MAKEKEQKTKKPIHKRWWFWLIIVLVILMVIGSQNSAKEGVKAGMDAANATATSTETATPIEEPAATPEPTEEQKDATGPEAEAVQSDAVSIAEYSNPIIDPEQWPELAELGPSNKVMLGIYEDFEKAWETYPDDFDEAMAYEDEVTQSIAEKYSMSEDQVSMIYGFVTVHYSEVVSGASRANSEYTLLYGDLLETNGTGSTIVVKAKIGSSLTNKMTIDQNYYNVCDLIRNQGFDIYDEIQYWAVADMSDGTEAKVISFTVPKSVIETIATEEFPDNQLGDYVDDLWIIPSLLA